ncbi:PTS sugar transporter subunit IIB, partial [Enterococcus faecium]
FISVLPWATPAPIGLVLGTGFSVLAIVLAVVLIVVDAIIYLPFVKAYDSELVEQELKNIAAEEVKEELVEEIQEVGATAAVIVDEAKASVGEGKRVLVLCAGAGTSAMLANALEEGAKETGVNLSAKAGAYGSHYDM